MLKKISNALLAISGASAIAAIAALTLTLAAPTSVILAYLFLSGLTTSTTSLIASATTDAISRNALEKKTLRQAEQLADSYDLELLLELRANAEAKSKAAWDRYENLATLFREAKKRQSGFICYDSETYTFFETSYATLDLDCLEAIRAEIGGKPVMVSVESLTTEEFRKKLNSEALTECLELARTVRMLDYAIVKHESVSVVDEAERQALEQEQLEILDAILGEGKSLPQSESKQEPQLLEI